MVVLGPTHRRQKGRGGENYRKAIVVDCPGSRMAPGTLPAQHGDDADDDAGETEQDMYAQRSQENRGIRWHLDAGHIDRGTGHKALHFLTPFICPLPLSAPSSSKNRRTARAYASGSSCIGMCAEFSSNSVRTKPGMSLASRSASAGPKLVSCLPQSNKVGRSKRRIPSTARKVSRLCSRSSCQ